MENEIAFRDIPFECDGANLRSLSDIDDERAHFIGCATWDIHSLSFFLAFFLGLSVYHVEYRISPVFI